jgi:hypothetical protein
MERGHPARFEIIFRIVSCQGREPTSKIKKNIEVHA